MVARATRPSDREVRGVCHLWTALSHEVRISPRKPSYSR